MFRASFETSQNISSPGHSSNPFDADGSGAYGASGATANDQETVNLQKVIKLV